MSSRCQSSELGRPMRLLRALSVLTGLAVSTAVAASEPLRVCSDPNNLPFSNKSEEGFENEIAELVAAKLGRDGVEYTWRPQRRGFVRNTLDEHRCDVIMGVPSNYELAEPTRPYYRSSYVFVSRKESQLDIRTMDDPRLRDLAIGVHVVGDDYSNTPGAAALGRRGIIDNLVGYSIFGNYDNPNPPSRLIEGVAGGEVDIAVAWGPLAGYFAPRQDEPLRVMPVAAESGADVQFRFDIAMAVRPDDDALRSRLNEIIQTHGEEIRGVLERYGVPLVERSPRASGSDEQP